MPVILNQQLSVNYTAAGELWFPPVDRISIYVTNGPAMAYFAPYLDEGAPYNGQSYEGTERPMTLIGLYTWTSVDFSGKKICAVKVRSLTASQLSMVSINA